MKNSKVKYSVLSVIFFVLVVGMGIGVYSDTDLLDDNLRPGEMTDDSRQQSGQRERAPSKNQNTTKIQTTPSDSSTEGLEKSLAKPPYPSREQLLAHKPFISVRSDDGKLPRVNGALECSPHARPLVVNAMYYRSVDPELKEKLRTTPLTAIAMVDGAQGFHREFSPFSDETEFSDTDRAYKYHGIFEQKRKLVFHMDRFDGDPPFPWKASVSVGETLAEFVIVARKVSPPPPPKFTVHERTAAKPYPAQPSISGNIRYDENFIGFGGYELVIRQGDQVKEIFDAKIEAKSKNFGLIDWDKYPFLRGRKKLMDSGYWILFEVPSEWRLKEVVCELTFSDLTGKRFEYESKIKWDKRPTPR